MNKMYHFSQNCWRFNLYLLVIICYVTISSASVIGGNQTRTGSFHAPLTDLTNFTVEGKHRFMTICGWTGFQPTSLHTKAFIETALHQGERGTVSFWFSPLEDLDFFPNAGNRTKVDRYAFYYPFISDVFPPNESDKMSFGIFWYNYDPQILGKFSSGGIWAKMDYSMPPYVSIEKIPMYSGNWYYMVMTWDKAAQTIEIYVNGRLMGFNHQASGFMKGNNRLYIGCPMMVMRELDLTEEVLSIEKIRSQYQKQYPAGNDGVDAKLDRLTTPEYGPISDLTPDDSWTKVYECSFTNENDLNGWRFQTDESWLDSMIVQITPEGLYFKTPDKIDNATRMTLWGPQTFEGDQCMELDFRLESPRGLALVVMCASGMGREDFIDDHGLEMIGKMSPILGGTRNYHWEFVRRVNVVRTDMETQAVYKNPWGKHLHYGVIPKVEQGKWYKLRLIKIDNRIQGSLDNKIVFDVVDNPNAHTGPVYNFGRIGLRQMYHTAIRYKNLVVYERNVN